MTLLFIDTNHYYLTQKQAKELCEDNQLPKNGYERKANFEKLNNIRLTYRNKNGYIVPIDYEAYKAKSAWIGRTPKSYWNGKPVKEGFVWALHLSFSISII
jgi:hypothetical protein